MHPEEQLLGVSPQLLLIPCTAFPSSPAPTCRRFASVLPPRSFPHRQLLEASCSCPQGGGYQGDLCTETGPTPEIPDQHVDGLLAFMCYVIHTVCPSSGGIMHAGQQTCNLCNHLQSPCTQDRAHGKIWLSRCCPQNDRLRLRGKAKPRRPTPCSPAPSEGHLPPPLSICARQGPRSRAAPQR